ncbi:MAG: peptidylprolyl isomerase [Ignavibacteriota bacterium]
MKTLFFTVVLTVFSLGAIVPVSAQTFSGKPQYQIEVRRADTLMGKIVVELFPAIAPNSVRYWDSLVAIHFYDSTAFHRVIPGFVIQGGDPNSRSGPESTWGYGEDGQATVDAEFSAVSHRRGILSAARDNDPNSASSQFFICVANRQDLDRKYSIYGRAIAGMNVADSIVMAPRNKDDLPYEKISVFITRLGSNDSAAATPILSTPLNASAIGKVTKTPLRWHHVSDAMMYRIQVATDIAFAEIIADTTRSQIDTSVTITKLEDGKTYYWRVLANNGGFASQYSETWQFKVGTAGVSSRAISSFNLSEASPNPSMGNISIRFNFNQAGPAKIIVQDILGREVLQLLDRKTISEGDHEVIIPKGTLPPGIYIYKLESNGGTISKRMIVE